MMTIYVVTQGDYSDYHICGVFSTKEKAEGAIKYVSNTDSYNDYTIEEWELDGFLNKIREEIKIFHFIMEDNGNIFEERVENLGFSRSQDNYIGRRYDTKILMRVLNTDREKALHIAGDLRRQRLQEEFTKKLW